MKRFLALLIILIVLCGCQEVGKEDIDPNQRYFSLIDSIKEHEVFTEASNYYDISGEMAKIDGGYRYYVTIDEPTSALYDVEVLAIEENVDYRNSMAANAGIFEDSEYTMIPNQKNPDKGYVTGIVVSGVSEKPETTLYVYVSFKNKDYTNIHNEYLKLDVKYESE